MERKKQNGYFLQTDLKKKKLKLQIKIHHLQKEENKIKDLGLHLVKMMKQQQRKQIGGGWQNNNKQMVVDCVAGANG